MKRVITLVVENDVDFIADEVMNLVRVGAGESCDDQWYSLSVTLGDDEVIERCSQCGHYMDAHDSFDRCPA